MKFLLQENLPEITEETETVSSPVTIHLLDVKNGARRLEELGFGYEGELDFKEAAFNKVEAEQEYFSGTLAIPNTCNLMGKRFRIIFFVNKYHIVFINEDNFALELLLRLRRKRIAPGETREKFLSLFFSEIISKDALLLEDYEKKLMWMEEEALYRESEDFLSRMLDVRKKLLILRGYYEQISEMAKILEENENDIFAKKQLKYFGTVSDRAERLFQRTVHLIDYANQVKDVYQGQIDARQNRNMQFLTVISTIFFPLTLITGWYGMNFENMPELKEGYPIVILASVIVVIICIMVFKKKKIL